MAHDHDHHHDHEHGSDLDEMTLRVRALETILLEKGYVEPAAIDALIEAYEKKIGPRNGAHVVAKAWADPKFKEWLIKDGTAAMESLGYARPLRQSPGGAGEHAQCAQHGRVHFVLLLPVGAPRPAAALVQIGALSLAHRLRARAAC